DSKPKYAARSAKRSSPSPSSRLASANHSSSDRSLAAELSLRSGIGATESGVAIDAISLRRRNQKSTPAAARVKIATRASHNRRSLSCQAPCPSFGSDKLNPRGHSLRRKFLNVLQACSILCPMLASSLSNQVGGLGCSASCQR